MIDLAKIKYRLVVMDENKNQYNIKEYVENLGWEENDGELAVRLSFVAKMIRHQKGICQRSSSLDAWSGYLRMTEPPRVRKWHVDMWKRGIRLRKTEDTP